MESNITTRGWTFFAAATLAATSLAMPALSAEEKSEQQGAQQNNRGRKRFYSKVKAGQYHLTKDGRRSYMLHEDLMRAAEGDRQTESTVASHAPAVDSQAA